MNQTKQKRSTGRNIKRIIKWIIMIPSVMILLAILLLVSPKIYNSISLFSFSQKFFAYPLPPQTTLISQSSEYRSSGGTGHHCVFLATVLVTTTLTEQEMEEYYTNVSFPAVQSDSPLWGLNVRIPPRVQFISTTTAEISLVDGLYLGFRSWDFKCR